MKILGRDCTLSRSLDETCAAVERLDPMRDGAAMFAQAAKAQPGLQRLPDGRTASPEQQVALGALLVLRVKGIPAVVTELVRRINAPDAPEALRFAIVAALALLALPRDIVPDGAPGGYGFIDDAALLGAANLLVLEADGSDEKGLKLWQESVRLLTGLVPAQSRHMMVDALNGMALSFQTLSKVPSEAAEMATEALLDLPGAAAAQVPVPHPGWSPPFSVPAGSSSDPHWSHGAYFEGNDVVIPGGPSLIGGQVFVP